MNYAGIRYCPRCGTNIFKTVQRQDGSIVAWCAECKHTTVICDFDSDPMMSTFYEMADKIEKKKKK